MIGGDQQRQRRIKTQPGGYADDDAAGVGTVRAARRPHATAGRRGHQQRGCSRCGKTGTVIWDAARNKRQRLPPREENTGAAAQCRTPALAPATSPAIVTLPTAKPASARDHHPLDGPALSHPGSRRRFSCATPGPRSRNAHMAYRGRSGRTGRLPCRLMGSQKDGITMCGTHSGVILIERCGGRKVGTRIRRYSDEEIQWSSPVLPLALVLAADLLPPAPAYGQEQAVLFCETGTPRTQNHTVCALINHTND